MRVYISGPITGCPDYKEKFSQAEHELKKQGYSVINPAAFDDVLPEDMTYEEHMQHDLFLMDMCGAISLMPGWEKSAGANREYGYALGKGMPVFRFHVLVPPVQEEIVPKPEVEPVEEPKKPEEPAKEPSKKNKPKDKKNKKDIVRELLEKGLTIRQIAEQSGIKYTTVWTCVERIRKEDMSVADKAGDGPNADRHLCKICQYRPADYQGDKFGCAYLLITGSSRGCGAADCDKFVKGDPLKMKADDF